ncbi:Hydrogen peroxide-inducible genes activator =_ OxyR [hydrothermal vent metagenome]|uniref:Hydrogen peroxide-inducible genes activator => OxyR n=1 Tax=hydrothermal vent metagenome TaxID=652676 RepID=A0A3B1BCA4_9ZZZZ
MNLRDLEYLLAIDEERHFHRAADRCFVSQPTLSGQLKKLEQELGVQLVERSKRQVRMTEAGRAVADQARRVLNEARAIKSIAQIFHDPMQGELQLGLIPTVAPYLLPLIMPLFKKQYPDLKLWLHEQQTSVLLGKLRSVELDLLILALPVETDEFEELDLFSEAFWLAAPKHEPLTKKKSINLTDLQDREMLLLEEGHCLRGQALEVCFSAGAHENAGFRATSLETLRHMVGEGMGMTLIPDLAVPKRRLKTDPVVYIPFRKPKPRRRIGMLYRKDSYREAVFQNMAVLIREYMLAQD